MKRDKQGKFVSNKRKPKAQKPSIHAASDAQVLAAVKELMADPTGLDALARAGGRTLAEEEKKRGGPVFPTKPARIRSRADVNMIEGAPLGNTRGIAVSEGFPEPRMTRYLAEYDKSKHPTSDELLDKLRAIRADRQQQYGSSVPHFTKVARVWNALLGLDEVIEPHHVPIMMILMKCVRADHAYDEDNMLDVMGYALTHEDLFNAPA